MMNYNEFKAAKCTKCENNCAAGYGCDFTEAYMNCVKEENNMKTIETNNVNYVKEEKKMNYKNEYPIAVKVNSFEQSAIKLATLRKAYAEADNSTLYKAFYSIFHSAPVVDDNNNVLYQKDHGYYKLQFVSASVFKEKAQGIVPKKCTKDDAIKAVQKWTRTMNAAFDTKFLNKMYTMICGHGIVEINDEGFGGREALYKASKKFTFADKATLEEFDVKAPKVKIFNGYLDNNTPFIEVTTCGESTDETCSCNYLVIPAPKTPTERVILRDTTNCTFFGTRGAHFTINDTYAKRKGYFTSAISTANYRSYAPKDEGLSYYAIREGGKTKQADYDEYLDHSEMSMFDKAITHELADAWRDFAATLSDEDKKFFGVDDNPQGLSEYDPEQEGFAFPYPASRDIDEDEYELTLMALESAIVRPKF